jgi:hypothetical protein
METTTMATTDTAGFGGGDTKGGALKSETERWIGQGSAEALGLEWEPPPRDSRDLN